MSVAKQIFPAILVMDSRNMVRSLRLHNHPFAGWSRLYQAGPYYLDINFKAGEKGGRLIGQVASRQVADFSTGLLRLKLGGGWLEKSLEPSGRFSMDVDQLPDCCLELWLGEDKVTLNKLDLS